MQITLNKLNKIRNTLESMSFVPVNTVQLRTDSKNPGDEYRVAVNTFESSVVKLLDSCEAIQEIRSLIDKINHENGIHELIANIAGYEKKLNALGQIRLYSTGVPYDDFQSKVDHINLHNDKSTNPVAHSKVSVSLLEDKTLEFIEGLKKNIKKQIEIHKEERNSLNHKILVELPKEIETFLRKEDLL